MSSTVFPSRTNLKLHNISITPKMVNKVITNLDSKASGPDFIPVVVLKNCEPELSYILAKLFNKCLKESCFPDSSVVPVFKNVGERSTAKNYRPVSLLSDNPSSKLVILRRGRNRVERKVHHSKSSISVMEFQVRYLALS